MRFVFLDGCQSYLADRLLVPSISSLIARTYAAAQSFALNSNAYFDAGLQGRLPSALVMTNMLDDFAKHVGNLSFVVHSKSKQLLHCCGVYLGNEFQVLKRGFVSPAQANGFESDSDDSIRVFGSLLKPTPLDSIKLDSMYRCNSDRSI